MPEKSVVILVGVAVQNRVFDLAADPGEAQNLALENPQKLGEMFWAMSAALDRSGAEFPLADDKVSTLKPTLSN